MPEIFAFGFRSVGGGFDDFDDFRECCFAFPLAHANQQSVAGGGERDEKS